MSSMGVAFPTAAAVPVLHSRCLTLVMVSSLFSSRIILRGSSIVVAKSSSDEIRVSSSTVNAKLMRKLMGAQDADEAVHIIRELAPDQCVTSSVCSDVILAAFENGNSKLAFSLVDAMRRSCKQKKIPDDQESWQWPQPEITTYTALVKGLAASLRVSDAIQAISDLRRRGVPIGDEVPFGRVVNCPTCKLALAVVQPEFCMQLVACSKCRHQYSLMSGDIVTSESEAISTLPSSLERGLRLLQLSKKPFPSAVHSFIVRSSNGVAQTHRFSTETTEIPGQAGERVTVIMAAPKNIQSGFLNLSNGRTPGRKPGEPMVVINHVTGRITALLPAPQNKAAVGILPAAFFLATTNAATAFIEPSLPGTIALGAGAALSIAALVNAFVLPRLNQLPLRRADLTGMRQELLSQYELLQSKLEQVTQSAIQEVRVLARMCQLENKMTSVGQDIYSCRLQRVRKARQEIEERLSACIELVDSYAKIASMIEIEVEMEIDVIPSGGAMINIEEQIVRLMELEELQNKWKFQSEASEEVERLLMNE